MTREENEKRIERLKNIVLRCNQFAFAVEASMNNVG